MISMHDKFQNCPIGMFDSGLGGLTVARQVMQELPNESIVYFGDTARVPYGGKSSETIVRYAIENTIFLMNSHIKLLVVACNTASAHSMQKLRQLFKIPIVDVVEAGVAKAIAQTKNQKIAVLGTKGTIQSNIYQEKIRQKLPEAEVISIACPLLVPLVEEDFLNHPSARLIVREYLAPLKHSEVDTLLLGCTHYPLLAWLIKEELPDVQIVDSAASCAAMIAAILEDLQLSAAAPSTPNYQFFVSDDPQKFQHLAKSFLEDFVPHVEKAAGWLV